MSQPVEKSFIIKYDAYSCPGYQYGWPSVRGFPSAGCEGREKLSFPFFFLFRNGIRRRSLCGLFLICTARNGMKENQRRQTHHVPCVSPSFGSRATCRQGKSTRKLDKSLSISFFLSTPRPVGFSFFYPQHRAAPRPVSGPIHLQNLGLWLADGSVRRTATGPDIKSFLAFLSKSSSLTLLSFTLPRFHQPSSSSSSRIGANTNTDADYFLLESTATSSRLYLTSGRLNSVGKQFRSKFLSYVGRDHETFQNGKVKSIN